MRTFRELFSRLPLDGRLRHDLRTFNLAPARNGKATSVKELAQRLGLDVILVDLPKHMGGRLVADAFSESGYAI